MNTDITALLEIEWAEILPFALPVVVFNFLIIGIALYDWFKRRNLIAAPYVWLAAIILLQLLGPILYLVIGRRLIQNDYSRETS
ncbi:PLDc N-terminal domain-containing protein [Planococcus ruber]|uniref:PLDc N-terminal domain-containing protein n=1 Tax=Planococcus ruber TaxID=2027871 RepID=UPI001FEFA5BF|nr:PLDc N-terminal domain-containing protein [Planococcus ruber]MCJ1907533.1 PLDc N-terminal domain-containing protein [Planococcus ruber]